MSNTLSSIPIFAPTQISGCSLWLDASDTTTLSLSGSVITAWRDKSGAGNNATPSNSPTYVSGSTPYVATRNANQTFTTAAGVNATTNGQAGCFYIVYADTKSTGGNYTALFSAGGSFSQYLFRPDSQSYGLNGVQNSALTTVLNSTSTVIYGISYTNNSSTFTLRTNGTGITFASPPTPTPSGTFYISGVSWGSDQANLNIYEIISVVGSVSLSQMQQIEGYLAWKWNLQGNLPSNHPFKNAVFSPIPLPPQYRTLSASIPLAPSSTPFVFGYSPLGISGLSIWYDGADPNGNGSLPSNGANISSWVDKSGNGRNATTSSNFPRFSATSQNNLGTIRFNGSSGTPNYLDTPSFNFGTSTRTAFFLIQNTGPSSGAGATPVWFWPNTGNGTNSQSMVLWINVDNQGSSAELAFSAQKNLYLIVMFRLGVTTGFQELFVNGTLVASGTKSVGGTSYANATAGYRLGWLTGDTGSTYVFDGNMGEILLSSSAISNTQRQQVEGYLAWKWGLAGNLPANHPFKNSPPGLGIPVVPSRLQMSTRGFNPLSLTGMQLWLDGQDLTTMFQNSAATTPVTATGQIVWVWQDKSSSGRNANFGNGNITLSNGGPYFPNTQGATNLSMTVGSAFGVAAYATSSYGTNFPGLIGGQYAGGNIMYGFSTTTIGSSLASASTWANGTANGSVSAPNSNNIWSVISSSPPTLGSLRVGYGDRGAPNTCRR